MGTLRRQIGTPSRQPRASAPRTASDRATYDRGGPRAGVGSPESWTRMRRAGGWPPSPEPRRSRRRSPPIRRNSPVFWTKHTTLAKRRPPRLMYVDTSVFMYACGSPSPFKEPCAALLSAGAAGRVSLVTSVETLQEILHRYQKHQADQRPERRIRGRAGRHSVRCCPLRSRTSTKPARSATASRQTQGSPPATSCTEPSPGDTASPRSSAPIRGFDRIPGLVRVDPRDLRV